MLKVAVRVRPVPERVPVPRVVVPFLKVTVPVGPVPEAATTVAVNTSAAPTATGLAAAATTVVVVIVAAAYAGTAGAMNERTVTQVTSFLVHDLFDRIFCRSIKSNSGI